MLSSNLIIGLGKNIMPKGVYHHKKIHERSLEVQQTMRACLNMGRQKKVRDKAAATMRLVVKSPEWICRVSEATKAAMHRPEVRERHLKGLAYLQKRNNFKFGNGQIPGPKVLELAKRLEPLGFKQEYPIRTKGHGLPVKTPPSYKVDFGHPIRKVAVEVDGPSHHGLLAKAMDEKKTAVLKALGWIVARIKH